jgi:5-methylcytosine-specific restriction enzyme subunit McrC
MKIPVQNIYFLLCYAWDLLQEGQIVDVDREYLETTQDLFARVLESGTTHLIKRGLDRGYITDEVETGSPRGKIDVSATIKRNLLMRSRVHCSVDGLDYNVLHNQILKTTLGRLVRCKNLNKDQRDRLFGLYCRLHEIEEVPLSSQIFGQVVLHRNNRFYKLLLEICRLIHEGRLISEEDGTAQFRDFLRDERAMARLFERFLFSFYRKEQSEYSVSRDRIHWQDVSASPEAMDYLPTMNTDISLDSPDRKIVVDAKYYREVFQSNYGSDSIHSGNLYQLYAYVSNLAIREDKQRAVEGILVYPTVNREVDLEYEIQGCRMRVVTIDLNQHWSEIRTDLKQIINITE